MYRTMTSSYPYWVPICKTRIPMENSNTQIKDEYLHDWVFHYNIFTHTWAAIPRELYQMYWSDYNVPGVLRSKSMDTLLSLLSKTKGDTDRIDDYLTPPSSSNK